MRRWQKVNRVAWKSYGSAAALALILASGFWPVGLKVRDGRHDRAQNGVTLETAWIGDEGWFAGQNRGNEATGYRDPVRLGDLARRLREHHVTEIFLRLPAPDPDGLLHGVAPERIEALLYECSEARGWAQMDLASLPLGDPRWRRFFVLELRRLLDRHPRLRGVSFNFAALPEGQAEALRLLEECRASFRSDGRVLSAVVGPWKAPYFHEVVQRADQLVVPLASTAAFGAAWQQGHALSTIREGLAFSEGKPLFLQLTASGGSLARTLRVLHQGLSEAPLPDNYRGVILEGAEAPEAEAWQAFRQEFVRP